MYRLSNFLPNLKTTLSLVFVLGILFTTSQIQAQATYDNNGLTSGGQSSITVPSGYNRLLVVHLSSFGGNRSVSFNGMQMTEVITRTASGWVGRTTIFVLPLGTGCEVTANVVASSGGAGGGYQRRFWAGSFQHVNQSNPTPNKGSAAIPGGTTTTSIGGLTNTAGMDIILDGLHIGDNGSNPPSPDANGGGTVVYNDGFSFNFSRTTARFRGGPGGNASASWNVARGWRKPHVAVVISGVAQENYPLDLEAPIALCQNITVALDANGLATVQTNQVNNGSSDDCSIASITLSQESFDCSNLGDNIVTLTVTDGLGASNTCNATVTIEDNEAPVASCVDAFTLPLDGNGMASISADLLNDNSSDNCGITSKAISTASFDCNDAGNTVTVTLSVKDAANNSSNCSVAISIEDQMSPTASCKNSTIYLDGNGNASITENEVDNNSSDNCGISSRVLDNSTFDCSNLLQTNTVTLTVTDVNGHQSTCNSNIEVVDNEFPIALCKNITVQLDANGVTDVSGTLVNNNSTDNCSITGLDLFFEGDFIEEAPALTSLDCSNIGANSMILKVTDNYGNFTTCTTTVTVEDKITPNVQCNDFTVQIGATGSANITVTEINAGSSDACGIQSSVIDVQSFSCADIGSNIVTLTVTDVNGNTNNCTATIMVEDEVAPTAACKNHTVQLDANGSVSINASDIDNGSSDLCSTPTLSLDINAFTCSEVGENVVILTVTDASGNASNCSATVMVGQDTPPLANCKNIIVDFGNSSGAVNLNITPSDVNNGSAVVCGTPILSLSKTQFSFDCGNFSIPQTTILTVADENGNNSSCIANVYGVDNTAPTAVCKALTISLDNNGNATINEDEVDNNSNDLCGIIDYDTDITSFNCSNLGSKTVTLTVTDIAGNTASCTTSITIEDIIPPTAICRTTTVEIQPDGLYEVVEKDVYDAINSFDNCGIASVDFPTTIYTCDESGNTFMIPVSILDGTGNTGDCFAQLTVEIGNTLSTEWDATDIGNVTLGNAYEYDPCEQSGEFTITGSGNNAVSAVNDHVAFAHQSLCGDGAITAKIENVSSNGYGGLMIRENNAEGAKQTAIFTNLSNILRHEVRYTNNAPKQMNSFYKPAPYWLRLERQGDWVFAYYSTTGSNFQFVHGVFLPMQTCVEIGLASFTYLPNAQAEVVFSNVSISGANSNFAIDNEQNDLAALDKISKHDLDIPNKPNNVFDGRSKAINLSIYPNPASSSFTLTFDEVLKETSIFQLYNSFGQLIEQQLIQEGSTTLEWDISHLQAGMYWITSSGSTTKNSLIITRN